ncbi:hypothetical protein AB0M44_48380 [Streptosporangium subroseum]|uniref:hypothetical protein n=1 Tax=Streptosporangium subroseum TaxID=106412 RepID=UPI00341A7E32
MITTLGYAILTDDQAIDALTDLLLHALTGPRMIFRPWPISWPARRTGGPRRVQRLGGRIGARVLSVAEQRQGLGESVGVGQRRRCPRVSVLFAVFDVRVAQGP